jgi:hypothetical protein
MQERPMVIGVNSSRKEESNFHFSRFVPLCINDLYIGMQSGKIQTQKQINRSSRMVYIKHIVGGMQIRQEQI